jgi:hypothetical protein
MASTGEPEALVPDQRKREHINIVITINQLGSRDKPPEDGLSARPRPVEGAGIFDLFSNAEVAFGRGKVCHWPRRSALRSRCAADFRLGLPRELPVATVAGGKAHLPAAHLQDRQAEVPDRQAVDCCKGWSAYSCKCSAYSCKCFGRSRAF